MNSVTAMMLFRSVCTPGQHWHLSDTRDGSALTMKALQGEMQGSQKGAVPCNEYWPRLDTRMVQSWTALYKP